MSSCPAPAAPFRRWCSPRDTDAAAVEGVVAGQGYEDFTVESESATSYEIRTKSINVNEQFNLRRALNDGIGEVTTFETTGGIETAKDLIGQTAQLVFKERTCGNVDTISGVMPSTH